MAFPSRGRSGRQPPHHLWSVCGGRRVEKFVCVTYSGVFARRGAIYFLYVRFTYITYLVLYTDLHIFYGLRTCNIYLVLRVMYNLRFFMVDVHIRWELESSVGFLLL